MDFTKKFEPHLVVSRDKVNQNAAKVGQAAFDILNKHQPVFTVQDILDEYQHAYVEELEDTIEKNKSKYLAPFHVVVLHKKEPWADNVLRNWFVARQTKPLSKWLRTEYPNHSHTIYQVDIEKGICDVLWSLPTWQDSLTILNNRNLYHPQLIGWIEDFASGKLDQVG